jgi:WS/DGAT/MGAT family acyltransferase
MNATDALFWMLEPIPEFRSGVGGLILLDGMPDPERVRAEFLRMAASYPRMRQRVVEAPANLAPPEWIADAQFDVDYHLRSIGVAPRASLADLLEQLGPLFASPLDRDRPLWEAYFAGPLADGRSAVFIKVHHCMMDGVGGTRLLAELLDERSDREPAAAPLPRPPSTALSARLRRALGHEAREAVAIAREGVGMVAGAILQPAETTFGVAAVARKVFGIAGELAMTRAESPLHHRRSLSRRLATFEMALPDVDAVRRAVGATNNDVLLTVVSGALHRWHTTRGADVKELRLLVPVNIRSAADDAAGNRIALLAVGLPVGEPNPIRRLRGVQERMARVKRDRRATLYPLLARAARALPTVLAAGLVRQQMHRTNLVCTNVPGPKRTCYLAGHEIAAIYAYAPMVGDHPVAIASYSYRDRMHVGLDVDPLAMNDLPHFLDALAESWDEVRTLRWGVLEAEKLVPGRSSRRVRGGRR